MCHNSFIKKLKWFLFAAVVLEVLMLSGILPNGTNDRGLLRISVSDDY
jgi:hypothetical protein